ncbi:hypothetical protein BD779DRAFT_203684 [Infundibulicybe gibba]|nr:hypothetical protein BD779DRAFT_203684 [Infundibulicybe gibba]
MQFSIIFVFASLALAGFAAPNAKGTVKQVELDIAVISTQLRVLDTATARLSTNPNALSVLAIGADIQNSVRSLKSAIDTGTADVKATQTPVAEPDGQAVFAAVQALMPEIIDTLDQLEQVLIGLPVPGVSTLIHQDLIDLHTSAGAFATALISAAPTSIKHVANSIKTNIDARFATALAAYS